MKKFFAILILIFFFTISLNFSKAETDSFEKTKEILGKFDGESDITSFIELVDTQLNEEELLQTVNYIEENPDKVVPVYYIIMADKILELQNDEDKALKWWLLGTLRSREDLQICVDKSYASGILKAMNYLSGVTYRLFTKISDEDGQNLMLEVMDWDEKLTRYQKPQWMCKLSSEPNKDGVIETYPIKDYEKLLKKFKETEKERILKKTQ